MSRAFFDVVAPDAAGMFSLPTSGTVTIGSAPEADIPLKDGVAAHLRFDVERRMMTVLGPNVEFGGEPAQPGDQFPIQVGEEIAVGTSRLVYVAWHQATSRPVSSHDYFDQRASEECLRAGRRKSTFTIVNVRVRATVPIADLDTAMASAIRLTDVLSLYAPGIYELMVLDTDAAGAELVTARIGRVLEKLNLRYAVGAAHYPADGRTIDELGELAAQRAIGEGHDPAEDSSALGVTVLGANDLVQRVSQSTLNVLILGETGSGKEVLAARVHKLSKRNGQPFLKLNCAAFTETLLESELFGHEKGSFTGAHAAKQGLLETADGGTVFLDEIGELPLSMQSKLLRVLEERMVLRVGGLKAKSIDVRFVAATNRDLEVEVEKGRFRADLYFRLDGATLVVPPLRERMSEFDAITTDLLRDSATRMGRTGTPRLSQNAVTTLKRYHWPGNIRELRNVLDRAVMLADGEEIHRRHLPLEKLNGRYTALHSPRAVRTFEAPAREAPEPVDLPFATGEQHPGSRAPRPSPQAPSRPLPHENGVPPAAEGPRKRGRGLGLLASAEEEANLKARERQVIEEALLAAGGNQSRAADALGISRRTLIKRIETYGLVRPRKR